MAFNQMLDMTHGMHPLQLRGGIKNFRKVFAGGSEMFIFVWGGLYCCGWGGNFGGGGHRILKENLKLHNPSIKSICRITSLIYFRCIRDNNMFYQVYNIKIFSSSFLYFSSIANVIVLQMLLHFQYCMSNILINIIISNKI